MKKLMFARLVRVLVAKGIGEFYKFLTFGLLGYAVTLAFWPATAFPLMFTVIALAIGAGQSLRSLSMTKMDVNVSSELIHTQLISATIVLLIGWVVARL